MSSKPILGYFDIKGRAEPIRLLLTYAGVDFEDKRYPYSRPLGDHKEWLAEKYSLGMDFPNLPYYFEGETKLTQTQAILHHLARKHDLAGRTEEARIRAEMLEQQLGDNCVIMWGYLFNPKGSAQEMEQFPHVLRSNATAEERTDFPKIVEDQLQSLSKYFGTGPFLTGETVVYADLCFYEYLTFANAARPIEGIVKKFANLVNFLAAIERLPQLSEYIKQVKAKGYRF